MADPINATAPAYRTRLTKAGHHHVGASFPLRTGDRDNRPSLTTLHDATESRLSRLSSHRRPRPHHKYGGERRSRATRQGATAIRARRAHRARGVAIRRSLIRTNKEHEGAGHRESTAGHGIARKHRGRRHGMGVKSVDRILNSRRHRRLGMNDLARLALSLSKVGPLIVAADHRPRGLDGAGLARTPPRLASRSGQMELFA